VHSAGVEPPYLGRTRFEMTARDGISSITSRNGIQQGVSNLAMHSVYLERAPEVFLDPFTLTIPNDELGPTGLRWISKSKHFPGPSVLVVQSRK